MAKVQSADGAVAFVTYFVTQSNSAYHQLDTSLIDGLVTATCKTCSAMVQTIDGYRAAKQTHPGDFLTPSFITTSRYVSAGAEVFVSAATKSSKVIAENGSTVEVLPADNGSYTIFLTWASAWKVTAIKANA